MCVTIRQTCPYVRARVFGQHAVEGRRTVVLTERADLDETGRGQEGLEHSQTLAGQRGHDQPDTGRQLVSRPQPLEVSAEVVVGQLVKGVEEDEEGLGGGGIGEAGVEEGNQVLVGGRYVRRVPFVGAAGWGNNV